jgi:phosphatidylserine decarboxylase
VDGLPFVGIALTLSALVAVSLGVGWGVASLALPAFTAWFFRDPHRVPPSDPKGILSPADGRVIGVDRVSYPRLLEGEATRVSIFMSVFNVHVNRIPFSGTVRKVHYNRGKYFAAYAEKASLENEQTAVLLDADGGVPLLFIQIAGWIARRIVCRLSEGDFVERGERYGLIRFGSRCDVYFPDSVDVLVEVGDRVSGGSTILGRIR